MDSGYPSDCDSCIMINHHDSDGNGARIATDILNGRLFTYTPSAGWNEFSKLSSVPIFKSQYFNVGDTISISAGICAIGNSNYLDSGLMVVKIPNTGFYILFKSTNADANMTVSEQSHYHDAIITIKYPGLYYYWLAH